MATATTESARARHKGGRASVPPLRNGEHLARPEFERRWDATPGLRRAELIEGIVFMPPPISDTHSAHHDRLHHWLAAYARATPGVVSRITPSLRLDHRNEYQPDCVLRITAPGLGRSRISPDDYLEGAPELVAGVAISSADYDAHEKRAVYERHGVQEYLLWQVTEARCDWWTLADGLYVPLPSRADGVCSSRVFPGLALDLPALTAGDDHRLEAALRKGLRSPAHAAFVRRLASA